MIASPPRFPDIQTHWARLFIEGLAGQGMISGFPDGNFRPNELMSRAQFAAVLQRAFALAAKRPHVPFVDVPTQHWANGAIRNAYERGFMSGYPGNRFRPDASIARVEVLVSLIAGLEITANNLSEIKSALPEIYQDLAQVPAYALDRIAIATDAGIVVNFPNIKLLKPASAATRAEVAAFVYQALVNLRRMPALGSEYIIIRQKTIAVSHQREFRAAWVTSVWNIDWPSQKGLSVTQQQSELIQIIDRIKALNFNALILQVRPTGDALYDSRLEPWSEWLTGTQGKAPEPFYDPLEFAIAQCHQRNIELHAWFNPYRAKTSSQASANVSPHITITNPEFVYQYGNQQWMDPGVKIIQDRTYDVIMDVVRRYDVDGIHLDDYFYPYPISGQNFPDQKTYTAYTTAGGTLSLGDWRRDNVNQMIQRLSAGIRGTKRYVKFGISPFGIYRPGQPPQIQGLDQYNSLYSDPKKWLAEGWVDYIAPQLYWRIDPPAQSYPVLLQWWAENNPQRRHIYPGNRLSMLDNKDWPISEYERQIDLTRNLAPQLALGNIFYNMKVFNENRFGVVEKLQSSAYNQLSLAPNMPWLGEVKPAIPTQVKVIGTKLSWSVAANQDIRAWTIYQQQGDNWKLHQILPAGTTAAELAPGSYAICAVDRLANESLGVVANVI